MVGRKSNNAEQRPSLGTAILGMLSSNVFHEKLSIQSIAYLWFGARITGTLLPLFSSPFCGKGELSRAASIAAWLAALTDSVGVARFRPRARSIESWLNLTFPAGLMSCNRRCAEHAKSCGKDVGLLWDLKGTGVNTRSPRFPRTGVIGFRCFSESSHGKKIPFAVMRDVIGARRCQSCAVRRRSLSNLA